MGQAGLEDKALLRERVFSSERVTVVSGTGETEEVSLLCGFASRNEGNLSSPEDMKSKSEDVKELAISTGSDA